MQSCVLEAQQLAKTRVVHAMHDATEGGFVAALNELAGASEVGFRIYWEKIQLSREVLALQNYFGLSNEQVLSMSSTGTVLGAVDAGAQEKVTSVLGGLGFQLVFWENSQNKHSGSSLKKEKKCLFRRLRMTLTIGFSLGNRLLFEFRQHIANYFFSDVNFRYHLQAFPAWLAVNVNYAWPLWSL